MRKGDLAGNDNDRPGWRRAVGQVSADVALAALGSMLIASFFDWRAVLELLGMYVVACGTLAIAIRSSPALRRRYRCRPPRRGISGAAARARGGSGPGQPLHREAFAVLFAAAALISVIVNVILHRSSAGWLPVLGMLTSWTLVGLVMTVTVSWNSPAAADEAAV